MFIRARQWFLWVAVFAVLRYPNTVGGKSNKDNVYVTKDGKRFHVVPPSAVLMRRIEEEVGPRWARVFNSTGKKLKSFRKRDLQLVIDQWQLVADQWIKAIKSVPDTSETLSKAFSQAAFARPHQAPPSSSLLCVHFASTDAAVLLNLARNVEAAGKWCSGWAFVFYSGSEAEVRAFETTLKAQHPASNIAFIGRYAPPSRGHEADSTNLADGVSSQAPYPYIPKPLLYSAILPILPNYRRAWLLDADLSLEAFDFEKFLKTLDCCDKAAHVTTAAGAGTGSGSGSMSGPILRSGLGPTFPVLIAQPVILQSSQDFPIFNHASWAAQKGTVQALRYDVVEQQAPLFDAAFLSWFTAYIIEPHRGLFSLLSSDWGLDDIWCSAARAWWVMFSTTPFGPSSLARSSLSLSLSLSLSPSLSPAHNNNNNNNSSSPGSPHVCAVIVSTPLSHPGNTNISGSGIPTKHSLSPLVRWRFSFGGFLLNKAFR